MAVGDPAQGVNRGGQPVALASTQVLLGEPTELGGGRLICAMGGGQQPCQGWITVILDGRLRGHRSRRCKPGKPGQGRGQGRERIDVGTAAHVRGVKQVVRLREQRDEQVAFGGVEFGREAFGSSLSLPSKTVRHQESFWNVAHRP